MQSAANKESSSDKGAKFTSKEDLLGELKSEDAAKVAGEARDADDGRDCFVGVFKADERGLLKVNKEEEEREEEADEVCLCIDCLFLERISEAEPKQPVFF